MAFCPVKVLCLGEFKDILNTIIVGTYNIVITHTFKNIFRIFFFLHLFQCNFYVTMTN